MWLKLSRGGFFGDLQVYANMNSSWKFGLFQMCHSYFTVIYSRLRSNFPVLQYFILFKKIKKA